LKKTAFSAYELILDLEEKIKKAEEKGLEVPDTRDELELAKIALNREDFALALQRAQDAELIEVLETKGQFNVTRFVRNNWWQLIISLAIFGVVLLFGYKQIRIWLIKRRIKNLHREEESIRELILETQISYAKDQSISESQYDRYVRQYEERLSKIKQERIKLRSKRAGVMDIKQELKGLQDERKEVQNQSKKIQNQYFVQRKMSKNQFTSEHQSNSSRLAEINAEEQILKRKSSRKKKSQKAISGLNKLTNVEFYTDIFKRKKTSRKRGRKKRR
jgi:hypothetical protein